MRVYNLTDVSTPTLQARGLYYVPIKVGGVVVKPGESAEVPDSCFSEVTQRYLSVGAMSIGERPKNYKGGKDKEGPVMVSSVVVPPTPPLVELEVDDEELE